MDSKSAKSSCAAGSAAGPAAADGGCRDEGAWCRTGCELGGGGGGASLPDGGGGGGGASRAAPRPPPSAPEPRRRVLAASMPFSLIVIFSPSLRERSCSAGVSLASAHSRSRSTNVLLKSARQQLKSKASPRSLKPNPMKACRWAFAIRSTKYLLESRTFSTYFSYSPFGIVHCAKSCPLLASIILIIKSQPLPAILHRPCHMHFFQSSALWPADDEAGGIW
mmetsp:Transcript_87127/g.275164  ORF Transcript_87127/g.275164 Transcript_87127/m.275164 type:complete len:222 (-) Transcript_87127:109-774(-)